MVGLVANFFSPAGVMLIEQKFAIFCLFMRSHGIHGKGKTSIHHQFGWHKPCPNLQLFMSISCLSLILRTSYCMHCMLSLGICPSQPNTLTPPHRPGRASTESQLMPNTVRSWESESHSGDGMNFGACPGSWRGSVKAPTVRLRYMNMLVGWYMIPEENFILQAEVAFVPRFVVCHAGTGRCRSWEILTQLASTACKVLAFQLRGQDVHNMFILEHDHLHCFSWHIIVWYCM